MTEAQGITVISTLTDAVTKLGEISTNQGSQLAALQWMFLALCVVVVFVAVAALRRF